MQDVEYSAYLLGTSKRSILVTACNYKRKHGEYPEWYKSSGKSGRSDVIVDTTYLLNIRQSTLRAHAESGKLYFKLIEKFGSESELARQLADRSEVYKSFFAWCTFMQRDLFKEPAFRFNDKYSKLKDFHKLALELL